MPPVRIVTDSTADLPEDLYQKYSISRVPLKVLIGTEIYRDGIDITTEQFYNRLQQGEMAGTSQPSPGEFAQVFESLTADGSQVICLTLSSQFSGTYQSARLAAGMVKGTVEVIDTKSATRGVGLMAMAASRAAAEGKTLDEIKALVHGLIPKMKVLFLVDSLHYLERGGRIGKAQAFLGSLLNIKPLLCVKDGIVYPYEKIRGKNKGLERIIQIAEQDTGGAEIVCAVVDGNDPEARETLYQKAKERLNCREIWQGDIGPVIGSHVGPGVSGIIYYRA
ncbi:DegV family protein [Desulforamulus putei]|uniref:EDD domain protein, DegV family n=1 Tax=Desulforamulus putei DSM 12395 TaxID=1121429 RepID=A0A1M5C8P5_9FIRM|nr:DegV family protein [Desulforamulus putei]SHF50772.1 EDD domain protein, DegV family [Desulforamulus putei DSM 12395]